MNAQSRPEDRLQQPPAILPDVTDAGTILRATNALKAGQSAFTANQVAYLIALAYDTGRRHAAAEDIAATVGCWSEYANPAQARGARIAAELAGMDDLARRRAEREGRPYRLHPGGPVDWDTGLPAQRGAA